MASTFKNIFQTCFILRNKVILQSAEKTKLKTISVYSNHCLSFTRCLHNPRELKKFYKNATVVSADGWFEINLDRKKLRTPHGNIFKVPSEPLALAIATEWNSQEKLVNRHTMHLTVLSNTALENPTHKTREQLTSNIIHFLETDTVCYRLNEPPELEKLQKTKWDPIIEWAVNRHGLEITPTYSMAPPIVSPESKEIVRRHLLSYSDWALFGYHYAVDCIKSLLIIMALVDKQIDVDTAVELARLEQEFQTKKWGSVEWYHDIELYELRCRLSAAMLFVHWCCESTTIKQKATLPSF
ncbi:ATP synthase mitochondrial F1 complex assembly factor 2-like [Biomphalaria glabrata]|uniref:ATP synthase mitochondrial F1 complex assembly factor 2-like n=2 Tax=Biomphalaria TaxID=6525 RepID=A0A9W2ZJL3_BIOGL|nr:ATP synthase mitochondrial F1 complex assembly factor 2-like [Biomphalaria glabrata]XP_055875201.1 ATP synthase mitochondrial F1 complex assembly factor 2-like [Biomphalaria glabrata]KAI8766514.1 ATP synthase mitochondrial F1 complex assembly factor 2-like [Biomphalaria glabrata]